MIPEAESRSRLKDFLERYRLVPARARALRLDFLKSFLSRYRAIQAIARQAEEKIESLTASRFSVFHFWRPDELALSSLIADFLSPRGRHGQGPLFLEKFLTLLNRQQKSAGRAPFSTLALATTEVTTETKTSHIENRLRRLDILAVNAQWALAVENKPWAGERAGQLAAYQAQLEAKYADRNKLIIYLSGDASSPQTLNHDKPMLVMGYQRGQTGDPRFFLSDWLAEARDCCQVDRVRHFLADWAAWVAANFRTAFEEAVKGGGHEPDGD